MCDGIIEFRKLMSYHVAGRDQEIKDLKKLTVATFYKNFQTFMPQAVFEPATSWSIALRPSSRDHRGCPTRSTAKCYGEGGKEFK